MLRFFLFAFFSLLTATSPLAFAAPAAAANTSSGVSAVIRTDGAMVYAKPDFDAEVLTTLNQGQKVRVSQGTTGAVVKFHKVRVGPVLGYVAEIDVQVEGGIKKRDHKRGAGKGNKKSAKSDSKTNPKSKGNARDRARAEMAEANKKREKLPFAFTRYVGLFVGVAGYEEEVGGSKEKDSLLIYGLKLTGPGILFEGPILDLNLMLHYGAPKAYTDISSVKPSGYLIMADSLLLLPML
ncbi:MAG: SH3 domain-containing protein, partial [Proteobacteria bacterium]